jgi:alpha/beta superfamily hydrolase
MIDGFRESVDHVTDVSLVARAAKAKYPRAKLALLGHSAGSVSAIAAARALGDQVEALILMAGVNSILATVDFGRLSARTLMVNHVQDGCAASPFVASQEIAPEVSKISVDGPTVRSSGSLCSSGTNHWFVGQERRVSEEVFNWIQGRPWARTIR